MEFMLVTPQALVAMVALASAFGFPTALLYLRYRHKERIRAIEAQADVRRLETNRADAQRVAELEAARADLEARVRTLETIVTSGDHDLEMRLRQLGGGAPISRTPRLPGGAG